VIHEKTRVIVASVIDLAIAALIMIIGVLTALIGSNWNSLVGTAPSGYYATGPIMAAYSMGANTGWAILLIGITVIIYGVKRLIDDILGMLVR
jgi:hypothetical protein